MRRNTAIAIVFFASVITVVGMIAVAPANPVVAPAPTCGCGAACGCDPCYCPSGACSVMIGATLEGGLRENGQATAVRVNGRVSALTAYHVVGGHGVLAVRKPGDNSQVVMSKILAHDEKTDLALLYLPDDFPLVAVKFGKLPKRGQESWCHVTLIGRVNELYKLTYSNQYPDGSLYTGFARPGFSGSGVYNRSGLCGVLIARQESMNANYAVPIDVVETFLKGVK